MSPMKVFAHRGLSGLYPENTMIAFQKASEEQFDAIELDVQLTRDGHVVVIHDERVDRTTEGSGLVLSHSLAELQQLNAARPHPEAIDVARVPTFEEYCEWASSNTSIITNIELKTSLIYYSGLEEKTFAIIQKYHVEDRVFFSSFNHLSLIRMQRVAPGIPLGALVDERGLMFAGEFCTQYGFDYFHPGRPSVTPQTVDECHTHGISVHVWTVDAQEDWDAMVEAQVDAVFTNFAPGGRER